MICMTQYLPYAWPATAVVTLLVGMAAFGFNVLKVVNLGSLQKPLQYVAGLAGLVSMVAWFCNRNDGVVTFPGNCDPKLASATWFLTALVALAVGLAACGCDLLGCVKMNSLRKPLQYAAVVVGAFALVCHFNLM